MSDNSSIDHVIFVGKEKPVDKLKLNIHMDIYLQNTGLWDFIYKIYLKILRVAGLSPHNPSTPATSIATP